MSCSHWERSHCRARGLLFSLEHPVLDDAAVRSQLSALESAKVTSSNSRLTATTSPTDLGSKASVLAELFEGSWRLAHENRRDARVATPPFQRAGFRAFGSLPHLHMLTIRDEE